MNNSIDIVLPLRASARIVVVFADPVSSLNDAGQWHIVPRQPQRVKPLARGFLPS
jgi:hypothetical protein